jgi:hypothetical protein
MEGKIGPIKDSLISSIRGLKKQTGEMAVTSQRNSRETGQLAGQEAIAKWQKFISEDKKNNPGQNNPLFFRLDFTSRYSTPVGTGDDSSWQFNVPGDISTIQQYWVQTGFFDDSKKYLATEFLETLQGYFPDAIIGEWENYKGQHTFCIGPFKDTTEADAFYREIGR